MPTYLYECKSCGRFEEFQKITDQPLKKCPKCEADVKKIIGSPGIIFKGTGFYSTDNKGSSSAVTNGHNKEKPQKEETKKETKKEKKTDEKAS
ncbi:MAG: FmdB family transcriptional regulator [Halanaerobiales bacterium]|nr:FmdB family transcriptional regulator [Halanaerobiales bacterium]